MAQFREIYKHANIDIKNINHFFKISGRYFLNNTFDYNVYENNENIFKKNMNVCDRNYYYTSFYKLTKMMIPIFFKKLDVIFNNKEQYIQYDLEVIIANLFKISLILIVCSDFKKMKENIHMI